MNIGNLTRVRDHLVAHPEHFDLFDWATITDRPDGDAVVSVDVLRSVVSGEIPACGSTGCIAGLTAALCYPKGSTRLPWDAAENALGVKGRHLFYPSSAPWRCLDGSPTAADAVEVLTALIDGTVTDAGSCAQWEAFWDQR